MGVEGVTEGEERRGYWVKRDWMNNRFVDLELSFRLNLYISWLRGKGEGWRVEGVSRGDWRRVRGVKRDGKARMSEASEGL